MKETKMFPNLSAFVSELFDDYSAHFEDVENCFYYRYLQKQKAEQAAYIGDSRERLDAYAARSRPNRFTLLRAAFLALKNGRITADEYKAYFVRVSDGKKRTAELMRSELATAEDIKPLNDALEKQILKNLVSDFFDNAGFKKGSDKIEQYFDRDKKPVLNTRVRNKYSKHSKSLDKYTDDIDMLYCYLQYKNAELSDTVSRSAELTEEFREECAELYRSLCQDPECRVFMPLYFDPVSGAGVFVIGKERFDKSLDKQVTDNCAACIVHFSQISVGIEPDASDTVMDLCMYVDICGDVRAAFEEFENGVITEAYLADYSDENEVNRKIYTDKRFAERFRRKMSLRENKIAELSAKEKQELENLKQRSAKQLPPVRSFEGAQKADREIRKMSKK